MLTVIASDADSGRNGSLMYSLAAPVPRHDGRPIFSVDANNGLITTVQSNVLDRELVAEYQLVVVATDRGIPRLSGMSHTSHSVFFLITINNRLIDKMT